MTIENNLLLVYFEYYYLKRILPCDLSTYIEIYQTINKKISEILTMSISSKAIFDLLINSFTPISEDADDMKIFIDLFIKYNYEHMLLLSVIIGYANFKEVKKQGKAFADARKQKGVLFDIYFRDTYNQMYNTPLIYLKSSL